MAYELIEAIQPNGSEKAKQLIENSKNLTVLVNEKDEEGNNALHWAAIKGDAEIITLILQKFDDGKIDTLELVNNSGDTPLHIAAWHGHVAAVTALLDSGLLAPDELNDKIQTTPLHEAAGDNQAKIITLLLDRGANINAQDNRGYTLLHEAALAGFAESVSILLARGANANLKTNDGKTALDFARNRDRLGAIQLLEGHIQTLNKQLLEAAEAGDAQQVADLLAEGADVNHQHETYYNRTALYFAASAKDEAMVRQLLAAGADVSLADKNGTTPLHAAAAASDVTMVNLLLEKDADPNLMDTSGNTALHDAALAEDVEAAKTLLNSQYKKVNINAKNKIDKTALDIAKERKNQPLLDLLEKKLTELNRQLLNTATADTVDEIESLLKQGADINYLGTRSSTDNPTYEFTALHCAVMAGNIPAMTKLLGSGADIEAISYNGMTALYYTIYHSQEAVELLLNHNVKVNINSYDGMSPLHYAIQMGKIEAVALLLQHDTNINALDKDGNTPLHIAAKFGRFEAAQKLLAKGADLHIKNNKGKTALDLAKSVGEDHVAKQQCEQIAQLIEATIAEQKKAKKAKVIKGLKLAALMCLSAVAVGGLVIGIGALAGWGVMVSLLSFAPWLALAITAAIASIVVPIVGMAVIGLFAYGIHRLITNKQEQIKTLDTLAHEGKQRLLDDTPDEQDDKVEQVLGDKSGFGNLLANSPNNTASLSTGTPPYQPNK